MMKTTKTLMLSAALLMSVSLTAHAAKMDGAPEGPANCEGLRLATGPEGKGYDRLGSDLKKIGAQVCLVRSEGGLDNLDLLSNKKADMAIVPIDALKTMSRSDENIASLQVVAPLNNNFLHVATMANGFTIAGEKKAFGLMEGDKKRIVITKFSQLRGAPVALVGSAQLLGQQLNATLGLQLRMVNAPSDKAAVDMLKKGQVYAVMSVASWPHGFFKGLSQADGVTLIPFDVNANGPYTVRALNYKNMGVYNVNSLGVQNLLVARKFNGARNNDVANVKKALAANLNELKDGDFEPAWNEIKSLDAKVDWPNVFGK